MSSEIKIKITDREKRNRAPIVSAAQPICGACKVQFSRYTCPHCNLHYCSLPCFRSPTHSTCSESFDKKTLMDDIRSGQDKTGEEKRAMMAMLKRFEEEDLAASEALERGDDEDGEGSEDEDDALEEERLALAEKLEGVDLDSLSPEQVLELLSPAQREAFAATLGDPSKVSALVADEFQVDPPWWQPAEASDVTAHDSDGMPPMMEDIVLPGLKVGEDGAVVANASLAYNCLAVILVYAHVLRTFSLPSFFSLAQEAPERSPAIDLLSTLVPFLVEKSTLVLHDIGEAVQYVVSRQQSKSFPPPHVILLLRDAATLLLPSSISTISTDTSPLSALSTHPSRLLFHALFDLYALFSLSSPSSSKSSKLARLKLAYYLSLVSHPSSPITSHRLESISRKLSVEASEREDELEKGEEEAESQTEAVQNTSIVPEVEPRRAFIEEIP